MSFMYLAYGYEFHWRSFFEIDNTEFIGVAYALSAFCAQMMGISLLFWVMKLPASLFHDLHVPFFLFSTVTLWKCFM